MGREKMGKIDEGGEIGVGEDSHNSAIVQALLDVEIIGIIVLMGNGECALFNRGAENITGFMREEVLGKPVLGRIFSGKCGEDVQKTKAGGGSLKNREVRIKRKDGSEKDVILSMSPFRSALGGNGGYIVFLIDNTEKRHLQNLLMHSQKMEIVGEMAGGIAHDFNNLLEGILGYTSFVMRHMDKQNRMYSYLQIIHQSAQKAADLSERLLTFSKEHETEFTPVNVNALLKSVVKLLERSIDKRISIELQLSKKLKAVLGASGQLEQAFLNVCLNARDAMPQGGKLMISSENVKLDESYPRMSLKMKPGEYIKVSVADTGIGMDREVMERIFEPFFTTKRRSEGTGLGLSMVYGIIDRHGGFINVYSEPGKGTIFNVYLPASGEPAPEEKPVDKTQELQMGNGEKVLFIDDEPIVRDLGRDMLEKLGYEVLIAGGAEEGMRLFREHMKELDLVILDVVMPGASGQELYMEMKKLAPDVIILLSSGYNKGFLEEDLAKEEINFIQKPYSMEDLAKKVRGLLDARDSGDGS